MSEPSPQNQRRSQRLMLQLALLIKAEVGVGNLQTQAFTVLVNAHGGLLEEATYASLSRPTHDGTPLSFARVDPGLFATVSSGKLVTRWSPEEAL